MPAYKPLHERLLSGYVETASGCWEWTKFRNKDGYGSIGLAGRAVARAHRVSWMLHFGEIPAGMHVLHRCDNPPCINPAHLFLGTPADNSRDKVAKGRAARNRGEKNGFSKLKRADVEWALDARSKGMTQQQIADRIGVSQVRVSQLLRNPSGFLGV